MRWPRRRKPDTFEVIDAIKVPLPPTRAELYATNPYSQETTMTTTPEHLPHWDDLNDWEVSVLGMARDIAASDNPRTTAQVYTGDATVRIVITAEGHLRDQLAAEYARGLEEGEAATLQLWETNVLDAARALARGEEEHRKVTTPDGTRLFLLTEAELDRRTELPEQPEPGTAAWLRDLADRVRVSTDYTDASGRTEDDMVRALHTAADKVERDERQAARDARERVEPILAARWAKDRDRQFLPSLVPTWDDLTDEERNRCIDYGLELYRAGRDDQEADRG